MIQDESEPEDMSTSFMVAAVRQGHLSTFTVDTLTRADELAHELKADHYHILSISHSHKGH